MQNTTLEAILTALIIQTGLAVDYATVKYGRLVDIKVQGHWLWLYFLVSDIAGDTAVVPCRVFLSFHRAQRFLRYSCQLATLLNRCDLLSIEDFDDNDRYSDVVESLPGIIGKFCNLIGSEFHLNCEQGDDGEWYVPVESLAPYISEEEAANGCCYLELKAA